MYSRSEVIPPVTASEKKNHGTRPAVKNRTYGTSIPAEVLCGPEPKILSKTTQYMMTVTTGGTIAQIVPRYEPA